MNDRLDLYYIAPEIKQRTYFIFSRWLTKKTGARYFPFRPGDVLNHITKRRSAVVTYLIYFTARQLSAFFFNLQNPQATLSFQVRLSKGPPTFRTFYITSTTTSCTLDRRQRETIQPEGPQFDAFQRSKKLTHAFHYHRSHTG